MILLEIVALTPAAPEWVGRSPRRRTGRRLRDRRGRAVEIGEWQPEDWDGLLAMYRSLDPAQRTQGLPPLSEERQAVWVDELWRRGPNVIARAGGRVVGHAALVADATASYELIVFVHQDYQGGGIGGALVDAVLTLARRQGAERVWSSVARHNHRALALYRRMGFQRVPEDGWEEETWVLSASRERTVPPLPRVSIAAATRAVRRIVRAWLLTPEGSTQEAIRR